LKLEPKFSLALKPKPRFEKVLANVKKLKFPTIAPNIEQVFTSAYNVNGCISLVVLKGILVLDVVITSLLLQL
jgi:hypothetical protein